MMKATIMTDAGGYVSLSYDNANTGERVTRTFFCPVFGGYVRERDANQQYPQVCEKLASHGVTLTSPSRGELVNVVRREYKAMRRAEKPLVAA